MPTATKLSINHKSSFCSLILYIFHVEEVKGQCGKYTMMPNTVVCFYKRKMIKKKKTVAGKLKTDTQGEENIAFCLFIRFVSPYFGCSGSSLWCVGFQVPQLGIKSSSPALRPPGKSLKNCILNQQTIRIPKAEMRVLTHCSHKACVFLMRIPR